MSFLLTNFKKRKRREEKRREKRAKRRRKRKEEERRWRKGKENVQFYPGNPTWTNRLDAYQHKRYFLALLPARHEDSLIVDIKIIGP